MKNLAKLKKVFIWGLVASLIISALVAVVTVVTGEFNEITSKVLWTLSMVMIHSLFSLLFIWGDEKKDNFSRLPLFMNALFVLMVISFFTSIFGIWDIIPGATISDLYITYFVIAISSLHISVISKTLGKQKYIDQTVYSNYFFIVFTTLMILPLIFINNAFEFLGEQYSRILSAANIINWTLTILIAIFYKINMHKYQEAAREVGQSSQKKTSIWVWILFIIFLIVIVPIIISITFFLSLFTAF